MKSIVKQIPDILTPEAVKLTEGKVLVAVHQGDVGCSVYLGQNNLVTDKFHFATPDGCFWAHGEQSTLKKAIEVCLSSGLKIYQFDNFVEFADWLSKFEKGKRK